MVRGVLHPPRTKEIPSSGADAIRPRQGDGTGISQWESSIEIRLGIVANLFFLVRGVLHPPGPKKNPLVGGRMQYAPDEGIVQEFLSGNPL